MGIAGFDAYNKLAANVEAYSKDKTPENLKKVISEFGVTDIYDSTHYGSFGQRHIDRIS